MRLLPLLLLLVFSCCGLLLLPPPLRCRCGCRSVHQFLRCRFRRAWLPWRCISLQGAPAPHAGCPWLLSRLWPRPSLAPSRCRTLAELDLPHACREVVDKDANAVLGEVETAILMVRMLLVPLLLLWMLRLCLFRALV